MRLIAWLEKLGMSKYAQRFSMPSGFTGNFGACTMFYNGIVCSPQFAMPEQGEELACDPATRKTSLT